LYPTLSLWNTISNISSFGENGYDEAGIKQSFITFYKILATAFMQIAAGQFKARCLELMDKVKETHEEIVITKYGKPVARLLSVEEKPLKTAFGFLKGTVIINGDIISPLEEKWDGDN